MEALKKPTRQALLSLLGYGSRRHASQLRRFSACCRQRDDLHTHSFEQRKALLQEQFLEDTGRRRAAQGANVFGNPTRAPSAQQDRKQPPEMKPNDFSIELHGRVQKFSPVLLRDMCSCPRCVDPSTRQKLFSTVEIPDEIQAMEESSEDPSLVRLRWSKDVPGVGEDHVTEMPLDVLRNLANNGSSITAPKPPKRVLWDDRMYREDVQDIEYEAYMSDDSALHQALQHLHSHGLLFLTNVPEAESSVSTIAERIGPVKNTFYGYTWDVRSVPQAKNVAYTAQDLGFHMDLLYMKQPPHLQFLHCIRASSAGGASAFTDSYKAAADLFRADQQAFQTLASVPVNYHYNHPESHYYFQARPVVELHDFLTIGRLRASNVKHLARLAEEKAGISAASLPIEDWIDAIAWSPPFQAPFSVRQTDNPGNLPKLNTNPSNLALNSKVAQWHAAAKVFNQLIHRPEGVYERMMKPGECVLFDNRRVLHARRAFEVGDIGKERWLRGAYLDWDPYASKMRVLQGRLGERRGTGRWKK